MKRNVYKMVKVRYTIKTVVRRRPKDVQMKYWTMELENNLEVDLGAELETDLQPSGREDGDEIVTLEISGIRLYDIDIELEHLPVELIELLMEESIANGAIDNLHQLH